MTLQRRHCNLVHLPGAEASEKARMPRERYQRPFDLVVLALAFVALGPLWLVVGIAIAAAVRLEDGGSVLYRQARLGRGGRVFPMLKFRTMAEDAERHTGPVWAQPGDARSTAVGRVLRRFHLDELPQVVNVLRGEMSLVGPRPERPELATGIERGCPGFAWRLAVRPGLAGLAQARGSYRITPRNKLRYDLVYIGAMGPWLDIRLCAACVWRALLGLRQPGLAGVQGNGSPHGHRADADPRRHRGAEALSARGRLKIAATEGKGGRNHAGHGVRRAHGTARHDLAPLPMHLCQSAQMRRDFCARLVHRPWRRAPFLPPLVVPGYAAGADPAGCAPARTLPGLFHLHLPVQSIPSLSFPVLPCQPPSRSPCGIDPGPSDGQRHPSRVRGTLRRTARRYGGSVGHVCRCILPGQGGAALRSPGDSAPPSRIRVQPCPAADAVRSGLQSGTVFRAEAPKPRAAAFIGAVETIDTDFRRIQEALGLPRLPLPRHNASGGTPPVYDDATRRLVGELYAAGLAFLAFTDNGSGDASAAPERPGAASLLPRAACTLASLEIGLEHRLFSNPVLRRQFAPLVRRLRRLA